MLAILSMPEPIAFVFTEEQRQRARAEALRRQTLNERQCRKSRNNGGEKAEKGELALRYHLLGAAGEMAVASYLDIEHELFKDEEARRDSDDLPGIDVKTRSNHRHDLIVQRGSNPQKKFVLVTIENQQTLLRGWCYGYEAMQERFWADPARGRPAYFVAQDNLRPMETLE